MKARRYIALLMALVLTFVLAGCGGGSKDSAAMEMAPEAPMENGSMISDSSEAVSMRLPENRKLICTVRMEAETDDLDPLLANLDQKIAQLGGYVEGREVYNGSTYAQRRYRHADLTVRIPAENLNSFVAHVDGASNVVSSNESVEDVTLQYVDTESRVTALEVEQERLLAMLEKAETMADLLEIEGRLTEVRYELERVASQLKMLDNQVSYSTVYLYVTEVQEYTPVAEETLWQRITGEFSDSIEGVVEGAEDFLVWVLGNSPYLLIYGLVLAGAVKLTRKFRRKKVVEMPQKDEENKE